MLMSLKAAETRIAAGDFVEYDPKTFRDRFVAFYRSAKIAKSA